MRTGRLKEDYVAGKSMPAGQRVTILEEMTHSYHCKAQVEWEFYAPRCIVELDQPACDGPAWHDVPTCKGLWISKNWTPIRNVPEEIPQWIKDHGSWYGPIPECPR